MHSHRQEAPFETQPLMSAPVRQRGSVASVKYASDSPYEQRRTKCTCSPCRGRQRQWCAPRGYPERGWAPRWGGTPSPGRSHAQPSRPAARLSPTSHCFPSPPSGCGKDRKLPMSHEEVTERGNFQDLWKRQASKTAAVRMKCFYFTLLTIFDLSETFDFEFIMWIPNFRIHYFLCRWDPTPSQQCSLIVVDHSAYFIFVKTPEVLVVTTISYLLHLNEDVIIWKEKYYY